MTTKMKKISLVVCLSCLFAWAYADDKHQETEKAGQQFTTHRVRTDSTTNKFIPNSLPNVKIGDTVLFEFDGTHTATSDDLTSSPKKTFNTGKMIDGQSIGIVFNNIGTFKYHCEYHGGMTGTIIVSNP